MSDNASLRMQGLLNEHNTIDLHYAQMLRDPCDLHSQSHPCGQQELSCAACRASRSQSRCARSLRSCRQLLRW